MPRFFTLAEAEGLLPEVERLVRNLIQAKQDYDSGETELESLKQRVTLAGGMLLSRDRVVASRTRKDSAARILKSILEKFGELGCHLKDIEKGLIDFPTLYRDREVYLCWRLGESGITFWHHVEEGFAGRQAIDRDFLENHRGDDKAAN